MTLERQAFWELCQEVIQVTLFEPNIHEYTTWVIMMTQ